MTVVPRALGRFVFVVSLALTACTTSDRGCSEYATPSEAMEAATAVYGATVARLGRDSRSVTLDTVGKPVFKGDAIGTQLTVTLPICAGALPNVGEVVVVFLVRDGDLLSPLPGTPGIVVSSNEQSLPTSWH